MNIEENIVNENELNDYVIKYCKNKMYDYCIVSIAKSYDLKHWDRFKAIAIPNVEDDTVTWLDDWYEGEDYIKILGIKLLDEIDV